MLKSVYYISAVTGGWIMSNRKTYKFFINGNKEEISVKSIDLGAGNYYSLVKNERKKNNLQLIFNSDRYLQLFRSISDKDITLIGIEFLEEDSVFVNKINTLLEKKDMQLLIEEISFFNQYNDIDIQNITLKGKVKEKNFQIILQNNGIVISKIENDFFDLELTTDPLRKLIIECLGLENGK